MAKPAEMHDHLANFLLCYDNLFIDYRLASQKPGMSMAGLNPDTYVYVT